MKNNNNFHSIILMVFLFFISNSSYSQSSKDQEGWGSVGVGFKISDRWSFSVSEHIRYRNRISSLSNYFTQVKADYELFKDFNLGGGIRFIRDNDDVGNIQGLESHFRYQFNVGYKHDLSLFSIYYRLRYQHKKELGLSEEESKMPNEYIRFRLGVGYKLKALDIAIRFKSEFFNQIQKENPENGFNRYRFTFQTNKKFKKIGKFTMFYSFQKNFNRIALNPKGILGLKYEYNINFIKSKK